MAGWRGAPARAVVLALGLACLPAAQGATHEWMVNHWRDATTNPDVHADSTALSSILQHEPAPATRPWRLCAVYPHLKDGYWLALNYGMVQEAQRLGVGLDVFEAGGYHNLQNQRRRVQDCLQGGRHDAVLLGTVSYDGMTDLLQDGAALPVFGLVNDIDPRGIQGKVGVPWRQLGWEIGNWLARRHPAGSPAVDIAWFLGPPESGWVSVLDAGFREAIAGSAVRIAAVKWGDTGRSAQRRLVEEVLETQTTVRYLVGTAVTAEVAVGELVARGLQDRIALVSSYVTPGVYGAMLRGRIMAAVSDFPVLQGRLAVRQALAHLEGRPYGRYIGPEVRLVEQDTLAAYPADWMLPPASFRPVYTLSPRPGGQPR